MYPQVTQFETRERLVREQLELLRLRPRRSLRRLASSQVTRPRGGRRGKRFILVLFCALALVAAAPAAGDRLPVSSRDDEMAPLANRISAVADVVATMDGRLQRIAVSVSPNPILPSSPTYPALISVQDAAVALLATAGGIACSTQGAADASGGETISDDDVRADDTSSEGIVEQLEAVATVLGQANSRLTRIGELVGATSGAADIEAAGSVWSQAAAIFNRTADLLANVVQTPPSPVCPAA